MRTLGFRGAVIGLTGHASEDDANAFLARGADAVVVKPVRVEELLEVLEKHVREV